MPAARQSHSLSRWSESTSSHSVPPLWSRGWFYRQRPTPAPPQAGMLTLGLGTINRRDVKVTTLLSPWGHLSLSVPCPQITTYHTDTWCLRHSTQVVRSLCRSYHTTCCLVITGFQTSCCSHSSATGIHTLHDPSPGEMSPEYVLSRENTREVTRENTRY